MVGGKLCICQCNYPSFLVPCTLVPINSGFTADPNLIRRLTVGAAKQIQYYDIPATLPRTVAPRGCVDTVPVLVVVVHEGTIDWVPILRSYPSTPVVPRADPAHPIVEDFNLLAVEPCGQEARPVHAQLAVVNFVADFAPGSRAGFRSSSCIQYRP